MTRHARVELDEDRFAPYEPIIELGARPLPVYLARQQRDGIGVQLVVAECVAGAGGPAGSDLQREARRISTLANQNLARVREVIVRDGDMVVISDFIDGEKIGALYRLGAESSGRASRASWSGERPPVEITLRFLVDALSGVGALHGLRDLRQQPMKLTHGEISPSTVLVGIDGIARVLHSVARRAPGARAEAASLDYLAPEVHANDAHDGRADLFSLGLMLWEALEGRSFSSKHGAPAGIYVRSSAAPAPEIGDKASWAKALVPVVAKALAAAPDDRWPTAGAMAGEIRKAAGLKIAPASVATAFAKSAFGERAKARRVRLESMSVSLPAARPPSVVPIAAQPVDASAASRVAAVVSITPAPVGPDESAPAIVLDSLRPAEMETPHPPLIDAPLVRASVPPVSEALRPMASEPAAPLEAHDSLAVPWPLAIESPVSAPPIPATFASTASYSNIERPVVSKASRRRLVPIGAAAAGLLIVSALTLYAVHGKQDAPAARAAAAVASTASAPVAVPTPALPAVPVSAVSTPAPAGSHSGATRTKPASKAKAIVPQHPKAVPTSAQTRKPTSG